MNKALKYIGFFMGVSALLALNACDDNIDPVIEELEFDRVFTPLDVTISISNQTTASFSWTANKGVESFVLEISEDSLEYTNIINTAEVALEDMPYVYELPAGDTQYSVRVKGLSETAEDSKWATAAFKSLPENLFLGYDLSMDDIGAITIHWKPGKEVTDVVLTSISGDEPTVVLTEAITAEEMAAGTKSLTDIPNDYYTIQVRNGDKVRAFKNYAVEGDVLLESGSDLAGAITAASPGDVIILRAGGEYGFVGEYLIEKSIKIKGLDGEAMPQIYVTEGVKMFDIGSNLTPADSIVFENLYMGGYVGNDSFNGPIRGIFDMENDGCNLGTLKFQSCNMYDVGRQIIRLRGGLDQTIADFIMDDCVVSNLGANSGSYGVVCATETNTNVVRVSITNSTFTDLVCNFIRYDDAVNCESITVQNCTFNKAPFASGRYIMDLNASIVTNGVAITNCIFGNTTYEAEANIKGIRTNDAAVVTVTNTFATTDFVNSGNSIVEMCTPLELSSTELWTNPDAGDFTMLIEGIEAGDPRWY